MLTEIVSWSLALILFSSAWLNLSGPAFVIEEFEKWNYPGWLRFAVGAAEIVSAILLILPSMRLYGAVLALAVLAGVLFSLLKTREWLRMEFPLLMGALCIGLLV